MDARIPVWMAVSLGLMSLSACVAPSEPSTVLVYIHAQNTDPPTDTPARHLTPDALVTPTPAVAPVSPACAIETLAPGAHISSSGSYTQTEDQAAGPMICRIARDSCAFGLLVRTLDTAIFFQEEEAAPHDDEDRRMHPAMLMPLSRLRDLVAAEWKGEARLVVSDAYDALLEHDLNQADPARKYSLHFEGRSIDLLLSPYEPVRIDRLCALAHCAGFDWVHHEHTHCHASVKAMSLCEVCSGQR
ncbi:MAG: hypothetical protein RMN25_03040 [Anaerolineae bacterium]|nr:hypothetical protein [Thermoflexales bacterium]MDW8406733.1 hypothetical protein [Anaerolineae bacterium]